MKIAKLTLSIFVIAMISASGVFMATAKFEAENRGDNILLETDTIAVEVKGGTNVPYFFFWHQETPNITYNLHLDKIFEVEDNNENGIYDPDIENEVLNSQINLASLNWEFSDFQTDIEDDVTTGLHFNLTSTSSNAHPNDTDPMIQFRVHLHSNNVAELKFDVVIDDFLWVSDTSILVVAYKVTMSEYHEMNRNNDTISFGDGYFQYEENATGNATRTLQVGLSMNMENENPMIYLSYEHFDGLMVHDPIIGVYDKDINPSDPTDQSDGDPNDGTENTEDADTTSDQNSEKDLLQFPELSRGDLLVSTFLATMVFILVPTIIYSRKSVSR